MYSTSQLRLSRIRTCGNVVCHWCIASVCKVSNTDAAIRHKQNTVTGRIE